MNKIILKILNTKTPSFENCIDSVKVIEAVSKSLKSGKIIKI